MSSVANATASERDTLLASWQYGAHSRFLQYACWHSLTPTSDELRDSEDKPATIIVVGWTVTDKLAVEPLGNFQTQDDKQQRYSSYQDNYGEHQSSRDLLKCLNAKLVIVLQRPNAPPWGTDYDTAVDHFDELQESGTKGSARRQWFLDKTHKPVHLRLSFPLWEKKKYTKTRDTNFLENTVSREDDVIRALREEDAYKAKQTTEYCSYVQDHYVEVFHTAAKTHHIRLPPVFFANGTLVNPDELPIRLDNALVEIMFHLKHYYYPPSGGPGTNKFKTNKSWGNNESGGNTFTATIDQVKILKANNVIPSPVRQPTMKAIQGMPQPKNNEQTIPRKRTSSLSPSEASLSRPKKGKNKVTAIEASSSSTLPTDPSTPPALSHTVEFEIPDFDEDAENH